MESSVPGAWPVPEQRRKHTLVWIISSTLTAHFYLIQLSHYYHLTFPFQQQIRRHELVLFFYHLVFFTLSYVQLLGHVDHSDLQRKTLVP